MPTFNITLEDTTPMIRYSSNWQVGSSAVDPLADEYSEKSFTVTSKQGESLRLQFYGTGVTIFGARRGNHGIYSAQLDGGPVFRATGTSTSGDLMQVLYTGNATLGMHTVTVTNDQDEFFDLDYVTFQTSVGKENEHLIVNTYQDDHPSFIYTPASAWSTSSNKASWFSGSNGHFATQPSAIVTLTFEVRDTIALYGPVGPLGTAYSVQIDNNNSTEYTTNTTSFFKANEVLFYGGNLGPGNHTLRIETSAVPGDFAIDYANMYTTASLGGGYAQSQHETPMPSLGLIVGIVVGTVFAVLAIAIAVYLFWRQRRIGSKPKDSEVITPFLKTEEAIMTPTLPQGILPSTSILYAAESHTHNHNASSAYSYHNRSHVALPFGGIPVVGASYFRAAGPVSLDSLIESLLLLRK
ncbi:hypothetical protein CPC08DRAFT_625535 [Agrocybe pediades]|nr:hypothetical protein CPC08DRAFT_648667 [Agrocybe pediades]KAF9568154.1 hypothetical protein CPC08DRAFT_625535 [Agrocybe pediades]